MKLIRVSMLFGVLAIMSVFGCGMPERPQPSQPAAEPQAGGIASPEDEGPLDEKSAARKLRPEVMIGTRDSESVLGPRLEEARETLSDGNTISFQNIIHFPLDKQGRVLPLYLGWDSTALGEEIINAYFIYQKRDVMNRLSGEWERKNVYQEKNKRLWYVPLLTLAGGKAEEIDMAETHWVTLELHLSSGKTLDLRIAFRAAGPLPQVAHRIVSAVVPAFHKIASPTERKTFLVEKIANPTPRRLKLWARIVSQSLQYHFDLSGRLNENISLYRPVPGPELVRQWHRSTASFVIDEMLVSKESDPTQRQKLEGTSGWQIIDLGPRQTVTLEWKGGPVSTQGTCALPARQIRWVPWSYVEQICRPDRFGPADCRNVERSGTYEIRDMWELRSRLLEGSFSRELALSDPSVQVEPSSAPDSKLVDRVTDTPTIFRERWGEEVTPTLAWDQCHGLFL